MDFAKELISLYGYFAIFGLLVLGIIGLPIPDEVMMTFVGYMSSIHILNYQLSILISFLGALSGMLVSYFLGNKIGKPLLDKYGKWIGLTVKRLETVHHWFNKYGPWTIVFGYFIPGVRHVTCYLSGMNEMKMKKFLIFAGAGAFIWCLVFITIGYTIGVI
ncbi:DedA family protein [Bacillus sp. CLL-7-23]|uniref:DedA family protein n=1 Tax=Bacillus changyiensis TaxID=3004103 RepID=A0ABT4X6Z8_9BACI|nr:DedA family protein [Bacillus changyiensis]MDA7028065.1 DedA family protein [Bacillus changyiensis]